MTKIDIYSGFLGAGKTTLIKKLVKEAYAGQKIVIIENEFGEIGIDGGFLQDAGVEVREMNSGCICCSLTGDFKVALNMVVKDFAPDRIIIEPSGVGKLSEVAAAVMATGNPELELGGLTTVVDAGKCKMYLKNFGEFFDDQVKTAHCVILSRTGIISAEKTQEAVGLLRALNPDAQMITAPWDDLSGMQILEAVDGRDALSEQLKALIAQHVAEAEEDDDDDDEDEHEHHHDDDDDDDDEHEHHHHHHHGHDADEVFDSIGFETSKRFTKEQIENALKELDDSEKYGMILRSKGIVAGEDGNWIHFDFVPEESEVRNGASDVTGKIVVIGSKVNKAAIKELFGI